MWYSPVIEYFKKKISDKIDAINGETVDGKIMDKLEAVKNSTMAIKNAIVEKGVDIPDGTALSEYAGKIGEIKGKPEQCTLENAYNYPLTVISNGEVLGSGESSIVVDKNSFVIIDGKLNDMQFYNIGISGDIRDAITFGGPGGWYNIYYIFGDASLMVPGGGSSEG